MSNACGPCQRLQPDSNIKRRLQASNQPRRVQILQDSPSFPKPPVEWCPSLDKGKFPGGTNRQPLVWDSRKSRGKVLAWDHGPCVATNHRTNQPTNQPTSQPGRQAASQPASQPASHGSKIKGAKRSVALPKLEVQVAGFRGCFVSLNSSVQELSVFWFLVYLVLLESGLRPLSNVWVCQADAARIRAVAFGQVMWQLLGELTLCIFILWDVACVGLELSKTLTPSAAPANIPLWVSQNRLVLSFSASWAAT